MYAIIETGGKQYRVERGDVIGVDWRVDLDAAWKRIGKGKGIQGNLDPILLLGDKKPLKAAVQDVLRRSAGRPGYIFNLGHGILTETPVENVARLAEFVHEYGVKG